MPEGRQLYQAIARHFPNGTIALYDRDLHYVAIDGQLVRRLGIDPESLTGKSVGQSLGTEEERSELQHHARAVFDGEQFHIEYAWQGNSFMFDFVPVRLGETVRYGLIVVRDVTQDVALSSNLAQALQEAKESLAVRDKFMTVAAHELKTPLTTIMGFSQLLAGMLKERMSDREQKLMRTMLVQEARLNGMINAMLDQARIANGSLSLELRPTDVVMILREVVSEMRVISDRHTMIEDYVKSSTLIEGDKDRLEQVFRNILSNAVRYTPEGGNVHISVRKLGEQITVTITDTGLGILPHELTRIFDQFARGSNLPGTTNTQISGMGIGLYISREIVHMHKGAIYASSDGIGQGATFTVVLPVRPDARTFHI
jgi:signal transduction histidine kinase